MRHFPVQRWEMCMCKNFTLTVTTVWSIPETQKQIENYYKPWFVTFFFWKSILYPGFALTRLLPSQQQTGRSLTPGHSAPVTLVYWGEGAPNCAIEGLGAEPTHVTRQRVCSHLRRAFCMPAVVAQQVVHMSWWNVESCRANWAFRASVPTHIPCLCLCASARQWLLSLRRNGCTESSSSALGFGTLVRFYHSVPTFPHLWTEFLENHCNKKTGWSERHTIYCISCVVTKFE